MKTLKDLKEEYVKEVTLTDDEKREYEEKTGTFLDGNVVHETTFDKVAVNPTILLNDIENIIKDRIKELDDEIKAFSHISSWDFDARTRHKGVLIRIEELKRLLG